MCISVIITTKDRADTVAACINSIRVNHFSAYEILVVDQSSNDKTHALLRSVSKHGTPIRYIKMHKSNLSAGRNEGVVHAKGDICAFTDDDCIVSNNWLSTIEKAFRTHSDVSAVFGKTLPYQPQHHTHEICPCVFPRTKKALITKPCMHDKYIGFGNNMAVRKSVFDNLGGFRQWLGAGSVGKSAEDAEFAQRILIAGKTILYQPDIRIYHNKWLTSAAMKYQNLSYDCGEMACYGYFWAMGRSFAAPIIWRNIRDIPNQGVFSFLYRLRGLFVGLTFAAITRLSAISNLARENIPAR